MSTTNKRIVLVTGGNNGIGLAICQLFANQPNYHVIMGSRSGEKGQQALSNIKSTNPDSSISVVSLDIVSDDSIAAVVQETTSQHGHIDILINNAGIARQTSPAPFFVRPSRRMPSPQRW
jgi:NAD(P)-dependent dehydrogenase (short-subunit alcohol dehydrogenase family)